MDYTKAEAAAKIISAWIEDRTHGKIKDLISPAALSSDTMMILVNAVYFKGMFMDLVYSN